MTWKVLEKMSTWTTPARDVTGKLLCIVHTYHANHRRSAAIAKTWGKDCDKVVFMTDRADHVLTKRMGAVELAHPGPEAYANMATKVWAMLVFAH
eukprot:g2915.t1